MSGVTADYVQLHGKVADFASKCRNVGLMLSVDTRLSLLAGKIADGEGKQLKRKCSRRIVYKGPPNADKTRTAAMP